MLKIETYSFPIIREKLDLEFRGTKAFHRGNWQGLDVQAKPEMAVHELLHVSIDLDLRGNESFEWHRSIIKPNTPWADNHFEERVCGWPINPGVEWANWPWGNSADKFREKTVRMMAQEDWAYLAGIIDGEGSFSTRTCNGEKAYPRIKITQVDETFITSLFNKWKVGTLRPYSDQSNPLSDRQSFIWRISSKAEVRWVIDGCLPFLRLKKERALDVLTYLNPMETIYDEVPRFNHNYMQRYWPKHANRDPDIPRFGINGPYGDLNDVVAKLVHTPTTRQAILPVYFPEDTALLEGRQPCSMYYHFLVDRHKRMDVVYPMRSCDYVRHFADDVYMTVRLLLWVLERARKGNDYFADVKPGKLVMHIANLHMFKNDFIQKYGRQ